MTEQERQWITDLINSVKESVEKSVESIKEIFLLRINSVEIQNKNNEQDIKELSIKQDLTETAVTEIATSFKDHKENHTKTGSNLKWIIGIIFMILFSGTGLVISIVSLGG